jgi:hypothetical protein
MAPFFMANTELGVTVEARQKLDYQSTESEGVLKVSDFLLVLVARSSY